MGTSDTGAISRPASWGSMRARRTVPRSRSAGGASRPPPGRNEMPMWQPRRRQGRGTISGDYRAIISRIAIADMLLEHQMPRFADPRRSVALIRRYAARPDNGDSRKGGNAYAGDPADLPRLRLPCRREANRDEVTQLTIASENRLPRANGQHPQGCRRQRAPSRFWSRSRWKRVARRQTGNSIDRRSIQLTIGA